MTSVVITGRRMNRLIARSRPGLTSTTASRHEPQLSVRDDVLAGGDSAHDLRHAVGRAAHGHQPLLAPCFSAPMT